MSKSAVGAWMGQQLGGMRSEMAAQYGGLRGEVGALGQEMVSQMANLKAELLKWMFVFWTAAALAVIGLR